MTGTGAKNRKLSKYDEQLLKIADLYEKQTGRKEYDIPELTKWAVANGHCDLPMTNAMKTLQKQFSRAFGRDYIYDDEGQPVKRNHAYRQPKTQKLFWKHIDDLTPEEMKISTQMIRNGVRQTVLQHDRNLNYFNDKINPGEPIKPDWNFNKDIEENQLPLEYPDSPPGEE